ncbi:MAG: hypothetical protein OER96_11875, partial [Gammaproteobacteria bacterium]|nr:hypothetical protein [Gammaproteobacteria bacterium]
MSKIIYLSRQLRAWVFILVVLGIFALLYYFSHVAYVKVNITTSVTTFLQVYWGNEQSGYAEERSKVIRVFKDKKNYLFTIPHTANITRIRIDPTIREKTLVILRYFAIYQDGYKRIRLVTPQDFKQVRLVKDIGFNEIDKNGLKLKTTGKDAQLEFKITPERVRGTLVTNSIRMLLLISLAWFVYYLFSTKPPKPQA